MSRVIRRAAFVLGVALVAGVASGCAAVPAESDSDTPAASGISPSGPPAVLVHDRYTMRLGEVVPGLEPGTTLRVELYLPLFTPGSVVNVSWLDDTKWVDVCRIALRDEADTSISGLCGVKFYEPKENGELRGIVLLMEDAPSGHDYQVTTQPMRKTDQGEWTVSGDPVLYPLGRLEPSEVEK